MQKSKAIHQFTPTVAYGDSVSNGLLFTQKLLHSLGYESKIYMCGLYVDKNFCHEVYSINQYKQSEENILLYHHSIGHVCHDKIMDFIDKKILIYHNITPSHFFKDEKHLQIACDEGREELKNSADYFLGSLADSEYNSSELRFYNYKNPISLPLLLDLDKKDSIISNEKIVQKYADSYNILFVGRVVQNKCQHQLIDVIFNLQQRDIKNIKLFIVGGVSQKEYFDYLKRYTKNLGLSHSVVITDKVSDEDLTAYYKSADLYLSLSEHEGFGMPLIEALKYDTPVLAYNAGGISSTVVKEGLLEKKAPSFVADQILKLQNDPYFRVRLLKKQKEHLKSFSYQNIKNRLIDYLNSLNIAMPPKTAHKTRDKTSYQVEGPFDSSYSLSIVNRDTALALNSLKTTDVKLHSTEGDGDFKANLQKLDHITKSLASKNLETVDITIRNLYPPRTNAMQGYQKIIGIYGWEESKFPKQYVEWFNTKATMILTMSSYVKNLLKENGVYTPIVSTGIVVEDILKVTQKPFSFELPSNYKLLHISSAFPRKGIKELLEAFISLEDAIDISLIIKTFPNPHNKTLQQLKEFGFALDKNYEKSIGIYKKDKKEILLINKDIPIQNLKHLYEKSNLLVAPSYGEGFGLPLAEAMLLDLPTLTTNYSGQTDFCTEKTSWLLDFEFEFSSSHMNLASSFWAVPKVSSIRQKIEEIHSLNTKEIVQKTAKAKEYILKNYSSKQIAKNIQNAIKDYPNTKPEQNIALFSSYNTRCGIATYSKYLISQFEDRVTIFANKTDDELLHEDSKRVTRCWNSSRDTKDIKELKEELSANKITTLILQYNFSFLPLYLLEELLEFSYSNNISTHLFLHSSKDVIQADYTDSFSSILASLKKVNKIYMHTLNDLNYLKELSIHKNTYLFTHGISAPKIPQKSPNNSKIFDNKHPTLATFGFLLPQKGILELVDLVKELHSKGTKVNLLLLTSIHPAPISKELHQQLKQKIQDSTISNYIRLNTDYLSETEIVAKLAKADKILFLYKNTQESSSAAVRMGLLSQKEVITTPLSIFDDVKSVVTQTKNATIESTVQTISDSLAKKYDNSKQKRWCKDKSWDIISKNFFNKL